MKPTNYLASLLAVLVILAPAGLAQTRNGQAPVTLSAEESISAARSRYTRTAEVWPDANNGKTLAQIPRRGPGTRPREGYSRGAYQAPWINNGDAGRVAVGAAIGFGLGALLGVKAADHSRNATAAGVVIFGGLGALFGGVIGGTHSFARTRSVYRHSWPEDDEESSLRSHPSAKNITRNQERSVSARLAPPGAPAVVEVMAPPSLATEAVP